MDLTTKKGGKQIMKYCSGCGAENPDGALNCERCGKPFAQTAQQPQTVVYVQNPTNNGTNGLCIAGFVLALLGFNLIAFILSLVGVINGKKNGEKVGLGIAGIVLSCLWMIVLIIIIAIIFGAASSAVTFVPTLFALL